MSLPVLGGAAIPVKQVTMSNHIGNVAFPVYAYPAQPTDNRAVLGSPAMPIIVIQASDLIQNGGKYQLSGGPAIPVMTAPSGASVQGGDVIAVYVIGGSL